MRRLFALRSDGSAAVPAPGGGGAVARDQVLPVLFAIAGVALRVPVPHLVDEAYAMKRAFDMSGWGTGHATLDPGTAVWPGLSFDVLWLVQHLQYAVGRLGGAYANPGDFFVAAWPSLDLLLGPARAVSIAAAAITIGTGVALASRLAGRAAGIVAGLLLLSSPLLLAESRLVEPDPMVALFATLALAALVAIQARGRTRDYVWAGVWIGLGMATKFTPVFLLPALFLAHATSSRSGERPSSRPPARLPWISLACAVAVFAATSPFFVLRLAVTMRDLAFQAEHMSTGHFGQAAGFGPLVYARVLADGLGGVGFAVGVAGLAWLAVRHRGPWRVVAVAFACYALGLSLLATRFPRYALPLLPPLAIAAGAVSANAWLWLRSRSAFAAVAAAALALVALLAPPVGGVIRLRRDDARPVTHDLANRWLADAWTDTTTRVAAEFLSVTLPATDGGDRPPDDVLERLTPAQRERLRSRRTWAIDRIPMVMTAPERTALYYDLRHYAAHERIVVSDAVRQRYRDDPARFAAQVRFYEDLDRYARLEWRTPGGGRARGAEIDVYRLHPEGMAALLRDRGPLDLERALRTAGDVDLPTFVAFDQAVMLAAIGHEDWEMAERYCELLLLPGVRPELTPAQQAEAGSLLGELRAQRANPH